MALIDKIRDFLGPKVKTCQYCDETKPKMVWGYGGWFCCLDHVEKYWAGCSARARKPK